MADINIERKRRAMWPFLIALVLIAALAFAAWQYYESQNRGGASETTPAAEMQSTPETTGAPPPVTTGY